MGGTLVCSLTPPVREYVRWVKSGLQYLDLLWICPTPSCRTILQQSENLQQIHGSSSTSPHAVESLLQIRNILRCGFDSRSGYYQIVTTWMGDCLRTGKPSRYITNTKVNSAVCPSWVVKSVGLTGVKALHVYLCRVAGNTVRSRMAGDAP